MIFKQNMVVVLTNGRLAGKKGVVVGQLDDQHILVAGVNRVPKKSEDYMPAWEVRKNSKFLTFVKKVNVNHLLATRFKADVGLPSIDTKAAIADNEAKQSTNGKVNEAMKRAMEDGKSKWLFTALKF